MTVSTTSAAFTADGAAGAVAVTGGTTVTVTNVTGVAAITDIEATGGAITVTGNASTTAVTANQSAIAAGFTATSTLAGIKGYVAGVVTINDVNLGTATTDTITTVTLSNYANSTIDSAQLVTLTLSGSTGTSGTLAINRTTADTTAASTTMALNLGGGTLAAITGTRLDQITTLNVVTTGTTTTTVANITGTGVTTLNVSGTSRATFTADTFAALTTVTSGDGGLTLGTALETGVTFTGGAGADSIKIGSTTKAITLGAGNDTVTTSTGVVGTGGSVAAGDGTGDKIIFTTTANAVTAGESSTFNSKFTGFETVELTAALSGTVNVGAINNASTVILKAGGDSTSTAIIDDLVSGGTVVTELIATGFTVNIAGAGGGTADVLNLTLKDTTARAWASMTAANVETVNINIADAVTVSSTVLSTLSVVHSATLVATAAKTITVTGNNGLTLTNAGATKVTLFDASGVVGNSTAASVSAAGIAITAVTDTAALMAVTYTSLNSTASAAVTIKGGAGDDILTGTGTAVDTITGGAGIDRIYSDNAGTKEVQTLTMDASAGAGAEVYTISGIDVSYTAVGTTATNTAALAAAINAKAELKGLLTAADTSTTVVITYLVDGNQVQIAQKSSGGSNTDPTNAETTAGTAGAALADTIDGGAHADILVGGGGADSITTGTGADTVFMMSGHSNLNLMATITDYTFATGGASNDKLIIGDLTTVIGTTTTVQDLTAHATLALAIGAAANTNLVNLGLSVFTWGGDSYAYVETTGATTTYVAGDFTVKLTGVPLAVGATIAGSGFDAV